MLFELRYFLLDDFVPSLMQIQQTSNIFILTNFEFDCSQKENHIVLRKKNDFICPISNTYQKFHFYCKGLNFYMKHSSL